MVNPAKGHREKFERKEKKEEKLVRIKASPTIHIFTFKRN